MMEFTNDFLTLSAMESMGQILPTACVYWSTAMHSMTDWLVLFFAELGQKSHEPQPEISGAWPFQNCRAESAAWVCYCWLPHACMCSFACGFLEDAAFLAHSCLGMSAPLGAGITSGLCFPPCCGVPGCHVL